MRYGLPSSITPAGAARRLAALLLSFCLSACQLAQRPAVEEYQPEYSQPGKDVVWAPTRPQMVEQMLDIAEVTPQDYVIDVGSGEGRIVIAAAKRGANALGIEYNPDLVELSKRIAAREGVGHKAQFIQGDVFESDFSRATVLTLFMGPAVNIKLRRKILELRAATRIVSNTFRMGDWEPDATVKLSENCRGFCTALLWIVPAKVEGTWQLAQGELALKQSFQMITGTLGSRGDGAEIKNGRLRGYEITFDAGDAQFTGRVNGDVIEGTFTSGARSGTWRATRIPGR